LWRTVWRKLRLTHNSASVPKLGGWQGRWGISNGDYTPFRGTDLKKIEGVGRGKSFSVTSTVVHVIMARIRFQRDMFPTSSIEWHSKLSIPQHLVGIWTVIQDWLRSPHVVSLLVSRYTKHWCIFMQLLPLEQRIDLRTWNRKNTPLSESVNSEVVECVASIKCSDIF
jgi:hypothetical protein